MSKLILIDKDVKTSYDFSQLVFNYVKNILAIGGVYYVLNKYDSATASSICWILFIILIYPAMSLLTTSFFLMILPKIRVELLIVLNTILSIVLSIILQYYLKDYISALAAFIASKS